MAHNTVFHTIPELPAFFQEYKSKFPHFISESIEDLGNEELPFSGDEIAALTEDIIIYLSSAAVSIYLDHRSSDREIDRKLVSFFTGKAPGGGPMLDIGREIASYLKPAVTAPSSRYIIDILNDESIAGFSGILSERLKFRNNLMHGTFLSPDELVKRAVDDLVKILKIVFIEHNGIESPSLYIKDTKPFFGDISLNPMFKVVGDKIDVENKFPLFSINTDESSEDLKNRISQIFSESERFVDACMQYYSEINGEFIIEESKIIESRTSDVSVKKRADEIYGFYKENKNLSAGIFVPYGYNFEELWKETSSVFSADDSYIIVPYRFQKDGIRHTTEVFKGAVTFQLKKSLGGDYKPKSKNDKANIALLDKKGKRIVALISGFHERMFHYGHLRKDMDFLADSGIGIIAFGYGYPHIRSRFSGSKEITNNEKIIRNNDTINQLAELYFTDKDAKAIERFKKISHELFTALSDERVKDSPGFKTEDYMSLRRLFNNYPFPEDYSFEDINTAASILAPLLEYGKQANWYEYQYKGTERSLTDTPVEFYKSFKDYNKFESEEKGYRMYKNSTDINRADTEVDLMYDTIRRDDIHVEYSPVAVRLNK